MEFFRPCQRLKSNSEPTRSVKRETGPQMKTSRRDFLSLLAISAAALSCPAQQLKKEYKIIGFTKPFQNLSHQATAETVAEIGWDGIECPVRPKGQIEPDRATEELPKLIEALKQSGKEVTLITTAITRADQPGAEKLLRTAASLGVKRYRLGFMNYHDKSPIPDQLSQFTAALKDVAAMNKEIGICGGVQNHSGRDYFGAAIWDIWTAIKDLDPQYLGSFFDIGHATIEGGLSWPNEARLMAPHMMTVSVKDFLWEKNTRGPASKWVPLGEGLIDPAFFKWLRTTSFDGPISHHAEYDHGSGKIMVDKLKRDIRVLREWLAA